MAAHRQAMNNPSVSATVQYISSTSTDADILRPQLICYRGMMFRKICVYSDENEEHLETNPYHEDIDIEEEEDEYEEGFEELEGGGLQVKVDIPSVFFKYIIGREGRTKNLLQKDTACEIIIPRRGAEGPVVIKGHSYHKLTAARKRINVIVWSNRMKEDATHFISIPLNTAAIMGKLEEFKSCVLRDCSRSEGVTDVLFQKPAKLHLTLVMLRLFSSAEVDKAIGVIRESIRTLQSQLSSQTFPVKIVGLDSMSDDPLAVNVLYAKVQEDSGSLQQFIDALSDDLTSRLAEFIDVKEGRQGIKLHLTVMNTKFLNARQRHEKEDKGRHRQQQKSADKKKWQRNSFDARQIMSLYHKFDFGNYEVTEFHLSKRGEYEDSGFYKCIAKFPL